MILLIGMHFPTHTLVYKGDSIALSGSGDCDEVSLCLLNKGLDSLSSDNDPTDIMSADCTPLTINTSTSNTYPTNHASHNPPPRRRPGRRPPLISQILTQLPLRHTLPHKPQILENTHPPRTQTRRQQQTHRRPASPQIPPACRSRQYRLPLRPQTVPGRSGAQ